MDHYQHFCNNHKISCERLSSVPSLCYSIMVWFFRSHFLSWKPDYSIFFLSFHKHVLSFPYVPGITLDIDVQRWKRQLPDQEFHPMRKKEKWKWLNLCDKFKERNMNCFWRKKIKGSLNGQRNTWWEEEWQDFLQHREDL